MLVKLKRFCPVFLLLVYISPWCLRLVMNSSYMVKLKKFSFFFSPFSLSLSVFEHNPAEQRKTCVSLHMPAGHCTFCFACKCCMFTWTRLHADYQVCFTGGHCALFEGCTEIFVVRFEFSSKAYMIVSMPWAFMLLKSSVQCHPLWLHPGPCDCIQASDIRDPSHQCLV